MNYGPIEFADYLRKHASADTATVRAARAARPGVGPPGNLLRVVSGSATLVPATRAAAGPVDVYEAVAMNPPGPRTGSQVRVSVQPSARPLVLVLSSHHSLTWRLSLLPSANLRALLLSGFGHSTVVDAAGVPVHRIGGFYAFKPGSAEYRHLESEVRRCTGHVIGCFQSLSVGSSITL